MTEAWTILRYSALRAGGISRRTLEGGLARGTLVRIRKGSFVPGDCPEPFLAAGRRGGRLDCLSLLARLGVFVLDHRALHVQIDPGSTRVGRAEPAVVRHWRTTRAGRDDLCTPVIEALAQACRCQTPRAAIATLDNAWHLGIVDEGSIAEVFDRLPARFRALRPMLDRRCESGAESLLRLLLRGRGWPFDLQVQIDGVGRVDFVIDGWLIVECDSEAHHVGWVAQRRDRRRDLAAARLGYTTLRPIAEDIFHRPDEVLTAIAGLLTEGENRRRAQRRKNSRPVLRKPV